MAKITLYGFDASPPFRACLLTLKALDLSFEIVRINIMNKEHLTDEYLKNNPQHTVPTLEDDGHFIWDSHAIIAYLVSKYGEDNSLYPKDLLKRAIIDQRMHFESGVMFTGGLLNIINPLLSRNETQVPQYKIDAINEAYKFLEVFLKDSAYIAGDELTIADFSNVTTATSLEAFVDIDRKKYPNVIAWIKLMEVLPYYQEANSIGLQQFVNMVKSKNLTIV